MSTTRDNYHFANHSSLPLHLQSRLPIYFHSWDDALNISNHAYLNIFVSTATLKFGVEVTGCDAIREFRGAMVNADKGPVVQLGHKLDRCFTLVSADEGRQGKKGGKEEYMVNGEVWYKLRNGRRVDCRFSSWLVFGSGDEGKGDMPLVEYYEVYLDGRELMAAIGEMNAEGGGEGK